MSGTTIDQAEAHSIQCMEIWGGNQAIDSAVSVHGIDAWVLSQPYAGDIGGGDIHYVSMCGGGRISRFTVADVSGHGQAVDELAVKLRSLMRRHINRVDQTRFARSLNQGFSTLAVGGAFATAVLVTYFTPNDHLIVCNAGHPPPLWYRVKDGRWQYLQHDTPERVERLANLPLGIIAPTAYQQFAVPLEKDDLILMYTDSLVEAASPAGRQLGPAGLLDLLGRIDESQPGRFCHSLLEAVADYRGGKPADDDLTTLLLHHNAADPPRHSAGETAKVIAKMLGLIKV